MYFTTLLSSSLLALSLSSITAAQDVSNIHVSPCERASKNGDVITVNYNGTFTNGTLFDSSYTANGSEPFSFTLGAHEVISGFDLALTNMCVGDRRKMILPPALAYGNRTVGPIPPNSTLVFWTELEGIKPSA